MDTVRADHVSGYEGATTTPVLAEIAEEGVRLQDFYAASSFTLPSHMSIFTGLDPAEHGVFREEAELDRRIPTLAETLGKAGYATAAFHEGGYVSPRYGFGRGFDRSLEFSRLELVSGSLSRVTDWIRAHRGDRYFLFVHTYAAHFPYGGWQRHRSRGVGAERFEPRRLEALRQRFDSAHAERREGRAPERIGDALRADCTLFNQLAEHHGELLGCGDNFLSAEYLDPVHGGEDLAAVRESYDERIRRIDAALGRIRETLRDLGEWDDTLLVVTADHGEAFLEHGQSQHDYIPFDEVLKVPAVWSWPRGFGETGGREVEGATWHLDLMPTILGLSGVAYPGRARGLDLSQVLKGERELAAERTVHPAVLRLAHREPRAERRVAVRGNWKYIEGDALFGDSEGLLFDRSRDRQERGNLRQEEPEVFQSLEAESLRWRRGLEASSARHRHSGAPLPGDPLAPVPAVSLTPQERQQLRELGYVD